MIKLIFADWQLITSCQLIAGGLSFLNINCGMLFKMKLFKVIKLILVKSNLFCLCVFTVYGGSAFSAPIVSPYYNATASAVSPFPFFQSYPAVPSPFIDFNENNRYVDLLKNDIGTSWDEYNKEFWLRGGDIGQGQRYVVGIKINSSLDPLPLASWLDYNLSFRGKKIVEVKIKPNIARNISSFYQLCVNYDSEKLKECKREKIRKLKESFVESFRGGGKDDIEESTGIVGAEGDNKRGKNGKEIEVKVLSSNSGITQESYLNGLSVLTNDLNDSIDSIVIMPNNIAPVRVEDKHLTFPMVNSAEIKYYAEKYFRQPLGSDKECHATDYLLSIGDRIKYHINIGSAEGNCDFDYLTGESNACVPEGKESLVFIMEQKNKTKVYIVHDVVNVGAQCVPGYHWMKWFSNILYKFRYAGT